ncbi:hypothetical protein [Kitasatospora sp. NPDC058046]|uniref:hypothetical protein n=1 Tax=Kitasatospora sp. NPDC058046 TaxID=3346312 RepID=UPI0036DF4AD4
MREVTSLLGTPASLATVGGRAALAAAARLAHAVQRALYGAGADAFRQQIKDIAPRQSASLARLETNDHAWEDIARSPETGLDRWVAGLRRALDGVGQGMATSDTMATARFQVEAESILFRCSRRAKKAATQAAVPPPAPPPERRRWCSSSRRRYTTGTIDLSSTGACCSLRRLRGCGFGGLRRAARRNDGVVQRQAHPGQHRAGAPRILYVSRRDDVGGGEDHLRARIGHLPLDVAAHGGSHRVGGQKDGMSTNRALPFGSTRTSASGWPTLNGCTWRRPG